MKKILILFGIVILLAITVKPEGLTGFFLQASSFVLTIVRSVVKQVLELAIKVL